MRSQLLLMALAVSAATAVEKPDGTCGYQCKADSECGGCGSSGRCSCPDGLDIKFAAIECSCVSAPPGAPAAPAADVADSVWPQKWTAAVDAWCYGDFSEKTSTAHGKFYYDEVLQRCRADWKPYINGKDATQVWVADVANGTSNYYVAFGPVCISFGVTDPGQAGKPFVGIERADWMKQCSDGGWGKYVGREQVLVGGKEEWVDHWSCRLDYEAANQSITFQNWHSLGLGSVPKGLPIRVTGGNSAPNPTKGSPRMNSVWYSDFVTGDDATKADDFNKPNFGLCVPVGKEEVEEFFGHSPTTDHVFSPDFHHRAHYLLHAKPGLKDLTRAKRRVPGAAFRGDDFAQSMQKLNGLLRKESGLTTAPCSNLTLEQLHETQQALFAARAPALDGVYVGASDTRRMAHGSLEELVAEQQAQLALHAERPELAAKSRDGICHEVVMWFIHHLTAPAKEEVKSHLMLPLLPEVKHDDVAGADSETGRVHERYTQQVSCAVCHVTSTAEAVTINI
ncbi:unnamed protein product [Polarella glacialis]|uniref:Uncharacterized protein n=1 Tax=Polarella glacialis TaxID=89957 RepID=A0A813JUG5_POLGL|nr:unnamed protein product [Polarella glacialis]CAE8684605.1 unnamed protein product [Polarella glacialis]